MSTIYGELVSLANLLDLKGYKTYADQIDGILEGEIKFALDDATKSAVYLGFMKLKSFCTFLDTILKRLHYINDNDALILRRLFARGLKEFNELLDQKYYVKFDEEAFEKYTDRLRNILQKTDRDIEDTSNKVLSDRFLIWGEFELLYKHLKRVLTGIHDFKSFMSTLDEMNNVLQNVIEKNSEEIVGQDLIEFR